MPHDYSFTYFTFCSIICYNVCPAMFTHFYSVIFLLFCPVYTFLSCYIFTFLSCNVITFCPVIFLHFLFCNVYTFCPVIFLHICHAMFCNFFIFCSVISSTILSSNNFYNSPLTTYIFVPLHLLLYLVCQLFFPCLLHLKNIKSYHFYSYFRTFQEKDSSEIFKKK